jgi:hypothetical protein
MMSDEQSMSYNHAYGSRGIGITDRGDRLVVFIAYSVAINKEQKG